MHLFIQEMENDRAYEIVSSPVSHTLRERLAAHAVVLRYGVPDAGERAVVEQIAKATATICEVLLDRVTEDDPL